MITAIVADDERIQREGIAKHIDWSAYGMQLAGTAEDGEQALALMQAVKADLLITDIKMPVMNGLALAEKAREINPQVKILIISGYDDFEYARVSIELKAYAYLLKPLSLATLRGQLEQISAAIVQERTERGAYALLQQELEASKPVLAHHLWQNMLYGFQKDEAAILRAMDALGIDSPRSGFALLLLQYDISRGTAFAQAQIEHLARFRKLYDTIPPLAQGVLIQAKENEIAFVLFDGDPDKVAAAIGHIRRVGEDGGTALTICISTPKTSLSLLHEAYKECESAAAQTFYVGKGKDIYYMDDARAIPDTPNVDAEYEQLIHAVALGNVELAEQQLEAIFDALSASSATSKQAMKAFCFRAMNGLSRVANASNENMEALFGDEHQMWDSIYRFDTLPEIRGWLKEIMVSTCRHIHAKRTRKNANVIDTLIRTIETRYQEPLTIEELAKQVHLTPNYISNIFKENIGESIIDYLTKIRMQHAVRLLGDASLKIYEVAEQTGYNSTSYFSVVFKGMYGASPKEYRDTAFRQPAGGSDSL